MGYVHLVEFTVLGHTDKLCASFYISWVYFSNVLTIFSGSVRNSISITACKLGLTPPVTHINLDDNRYPDLNTFIREEWEGSWLNYWDANDMLVLLNTWQEGDCSLVRHGGNFEKCLSEITTKLLIMPSKTDLYFPVSLTQKCSRRLLIAIAWQAGR